MKLDHGLIVFHDQMLRMEAGALRKNLRQLGEGAFDEGLLAEVVTGQRVSAHHGPVNVVGYMFKEGGAVAGLKPLEDCANLIGCDSHKPPDCWESLA